VAQAIADQAKLIHGQANIVYHKPMMELIDEMEFDHGVAGVE
jgi:hypothetical protein